MGSVRGCMMHLNSRCLKLWDIGIEGTKSNLKPGASGFLYGY